MLGIQHFRQPAWFWMVCPLPLVLGQHFSIDALDDVDDGCRVVAIPGRENRLKIEMWKTQITVLLREIAGIVGNEEVLRFGMLSPFRGLDEDFHQQPVSHRVLRPVERCEFRQNSFNYPALRVFACGNRRARSHDALDPPESSSRLRRQRVRFVRSSLDSVTLELPCPHARSDADRRRTKLKREYHAAQNRVADVPGVVHGRHRGRRRLGELEFEQVGAPREVQRRGLGERAGSGFEEFGDVVAGERTVADCRSDWRTRSDRALGRLIPAVPRRICPVPLDRTSRPRLLTERQLPDYPLISSFNIRRFMS